MQPNQQPMLGQQMGGPTEDPEGQEGFQPSLQAAAELVQKTVAEYAVSSVHPDLCLLATTDAGNTGLAETWVFALGCRIC